MKGFLHVSEVIVVIMIAFVMLFQFSTIPKMRTNWDRSKLILMSHDLLFSLDGSGTNWFNASEIRQKAAAILPSTTGIAVTTRQDVRPLIRVGCVCDPQNFSIVQQELLTDFDVNGMRRRFDVVRIDPASMKFSSENDVIIFWGFQDVSSPVDNTDELASYLSSGNGVVEFGDLTQPQSEMDWHKDIYNLQWTGSSYAASADAFFSAVPDAGNSYKVRKLFFNTSYELAPTASMSGYWRMNSGIGGIASDHSGLSNHGTLKDANAANVDGNGPPHWTDGKFGRALLFDGRDDYVEVPDNAGLRLTRFTTEAWFRIESLPADGEDHKILRKGEDTATDHYNYGMSVLRVTSTWPGSAKIACSFENASDANFWLLFDIDATYTRRFVHVACTLDGDNWKMYVDGRPVAAALYLNNILIGSLGGEIPALASSPLYIGAGWENNSNAFTSFFNGTIDEVIVYRSALSAEEVRRHYTRRLPSLQTFQNFVSENVYPADNDSAKIVVEQSSRYNSGSFASKSVPLAAINWGVEGKGRAAWMSGAPLSEENRQLLKSLVIWAAGGKAYDVIPGDLRDSVKATMHKALSEDMFEPLVISLSLGYYY